MELEKENKTRKEEGVRGRSDFWKGFVCGAAVLTLFLFLSWFFLGGGFFLLGQEDAQLSIDTMAVSRKLREMEAVINEYYYNDVDEEKVVDWMYKGLMAGLDDPYAAYYTEEELTSVTNDINGSYEGIGATLSKDSETGEITVVSCYEDTPAEEAGMLPGDTILTMNGESVQDMELSDMVSAIQSGEYDTITFKIKREGSNEELSITVEPRVVDVPTVESEMLKNKIGYIKVTEFDNVTVDQFRNAKETLTSQGMEKLIIDLRNNPGGNLKTVLAMLDEILPEGLVVYTEDKNGERTEYYCDGENELQIPLVVLVNSQSASASEIFAGAVKDYGIGTLVGETTYGKGIVQMDVNLSDGTAMKLTVSKYFTPNGNDIHEVGIEPDVEVALEEGLEQRVTIPKDQDNQLQKAIEILEDE